ncbi:YoaK family protein [Xanthomonas sp. MUS 060]|uniref:YoaK family protein n=1 Tax=Xanthomonas sp. MUS 060 TaxID=1588031 RepID=UPI0005F2F056|nr:YoaK family protein [Xanthomonas sp. MUS 060]
MNFALPGWAWIFAAALASVAGMVNVVGYLGFEHQAVTHLTGTTTLLGAALADADPRAIGQLSGVVLAFLSGAVLAGGLVRDRRLRLGRRYGLALALESLLLLAAIQAFKHQPLFGALLAATACGLQNATTTIYSRTVVRTTHLTGMFTDLGIGLGQALSGLPLPRQRISLSLLIIGGFLLGGVIGALAYRRIGFNALLVPALLTGTVGTLYILLLHSRYREREE